MGSWRGHLVVLLPLLLLALGLRLYAIDRSPLWTDELFTLQSTWGHGFVLERLPRNEVLDPAPRPTHLEGAGSYLGIYTGQARDTHPPGYYLLLRAWRELFGSSPTVLRLPSALASLVVVGGLYAAVFLLTRSKLPATVAALLVTLSTQQIVYAQEARGYMLALAGLSVAVAALMAIRASGWSRARAAVFFAGAVVSLWSAYLSALPLLAMAVYVLIEFRGRDRTRTLLTGVGAALLVVATVGPLFLRASLALSDRNGWLVAEERPLLDATKEAATALFAQLAPMQDRSLPATWLGAGLLLIGAVPLYRKVPEARPWLWWILAVIGTFWAWDLAASKIHLRQARYTLPAGLGLFALVAVLSPPTLRTLRDWPTWRKALALLAPLTILLPLVSLPQAYVVQKENWFPIRDHLAAEGPGNPRQLYAICAFGPGQFDRLSILYLGPSHYAPKDAFNAAVIVEDPSRAEAIRAEAIARGGLTVFFEHGTDPAALIPQGWTRTRFTNLPTVGVLATYVPAKD